MVLIQVTNNPGDEYYVQAKTTDAVDSVCAMIANVHNLRNRVKRLAGGLRELSLYGPMRPEDQRGLTQDQIQAVAEGKSIDRSRDDPHGIRVGQAPDSKLVKVLQQVADEAEATISSAANLASRSSIDEAKVQAAIQNCKGAVMMAYPMGLPEFDTVHHALEDKEQLAGTQYSRDWFDPATCGVWFAGKKFSREEGHDLAKYVGKMEKTTIKVKITSEKVTQAPQREPGIDAETQKKLMAMYYKKQEKAKRLAEADEDSYLNSAWANPQGFKQAAQGIGQIKFR